MLPYMAMDDNSTHQQEILNCYLESMTNSMQPKVKEALHDIWLAETREKAYAAFDNCIERFSPKYLKAMECLEKDKIPAGLPRLSCRKAGNTLMNVCILSNKTK